ncbi:MAG: hypothetical protein KGJ07_03700 [Patescibacteria group bacterium]|nr:hypothetical protein [Patescibacteria group bacterium]
MREPKIYMPGDSGSLISNSVAEHNITVVRNSININAKLPFVLYGMNDVNNAFDSFFKMSGLTPANITYSVAYGTGGDLIITYQDTTGHTDTITIHSVGLYGYATLLEQTRNHKFKTKFIRINSSDASQFTLATQLGDDIQYGNLNMQGNVLNKKRLNIARSPQDINSNILDLHIKDSAIDDTWGLVQNFEKYSSAGAYTLEFGIFFHAVEKEHDDEQQEESHMD